MSFEAAITTRDELISNPAEAAACSKGTKSFESASSKISEADSFEQPQHEIDIDHYQTYLKETLPRDIQQSEYARYFRRQTHREILEALGINPHQSDTDERLAKAMSAVNVMHGLTYLGIHIDELVKLHSKQLAPVSTSIVLSWNIIGIILNIRIIDTLFKQKQHKEAAALCASVGLMAASSVGSFLTLPTVHALTSATANSAIGIFGNFAYVAQMAISTYIQYNRMHEGQKRVEFYESEITRKEKLLDKDPTETSRNELHTEIKALNHLISHEKARIAESKKCMWVYGMSTFALASVTTLGILVTAGVITGVAASVVSMGVVPAAIALVALGITIWSHYHKREKADIEPVITPPQQPASRKVERTSDKPRSMFGRLFTPNNNPLPSSQDIIGDSLLPTA